jgi:hypothetical protein
VSRKDLGLGLTDAQNVFVIEDSNQIIEVANANQENEKLEG